MYSNLSNLIQVNAAYQGPVPLGSTQAHITAALILVLAGIYIAIRFSNRYYQQFKSR